MKVSVPHKKKVRGDGPVDIDLKSLPRCRREAIPNSKLKLCWVHSIYEAKDYMVHRHINQLIFVYWEYIFDQLGGYVRAFCCTEMAARPHLLILGALQNEHTHISTMTLLELACIPIYDHWRPVWCKAGIPTADGLDADESCEKKLQCWDSFLWVDTVIENVVKITILICAAVTCVFKAIHWVKLRRATQALHASKKNT